MAERTFFVHLPAGSSLRAALPPKTKPSCIRSRVDVAEQDRIIEVATRRTARGEAQHFFARALTPAEREAYRAARPVVETFPGTALGPVDKDDGDLYQGPCRKGGCGKPLRTGPCFCSRPCARGGSRRFLPRSRPAVLLLLALHVQGCARAPALDTILNLLTMILGPVALLALVSLSVVLPVVLIVQVARGRL